MCAGASRLQAPLSLWSVLWLVCMNDLLVRFVLAALRAAVFAWPRWAALRSVCGGPTGGSEYRAKVCACLFLCYCFTAHANSE